MRHERNLRKSPHFGGVHHMQKINKHKYTLHISSLYSLSLRSLTVCMYAHRLPSPCVWIATRPAKTAAEILQRKRDTGTRGRGGVGDRKAIPLGASPFSLRRERRSL